MNALLLVLAPVLVLLQAVCRVPGAWGYVTHGTDTSRRLLDGQAPAPRRIGNPCPLGTRNETGCLGLQNTTEVPEGAPMGSAAGKRPFKLRFYDDRATWESPGLRSYVMDRLMPAIATTLARIIRVCSSRMPLPDCLHLCTACLFPSTLNTWPAAL